MPKLERITADAAKLGRPATPADFGTGQGLENLGDALNASAEITKQIFEAAEQAQIGKARSNLAVDLNDFRIKLKTRPDHTNDVKDFDEFKRTATEKHRSGITTERGRRQFDDQIFDVVERARVETIVGARQKAMAQQRINTMEAVNDFKNLFIDSDDDSARQKYFGDAIAEIDKAEALGGFTPEKAELLRIAFEAEALAGLAIRKIRESRSPTEAREVVLELENRKGVFAKMDSTIRQQMIKTAEGQVDFLIRKVRLDLEYEQSQATRARRVARETAQSDMVAAMIEEKMTSELLTRNRHLISASMAKMAEASVRRGGGLATGIDYARVAELNRMEADRQDLFVVEPLDPLVLGSQYIPILNRQRIAATATTTGGQTSAAALKARVDAMKINSVDAGKLSERYYLRIEQWRNEPANRGKVLNHVARQVILNDLEQEYKETANFIGAGKAVPETDVEAPEEVIYFGVPQSEVRDIVKGLRTRGRQPTPQAMAIAVEKWRVERAAEIETERKQRREAGP